MFWDKMEKANYFLESILETTDEETEAAAETDVEPTAVSDDE